MAKIASRSVVIATVLLIVTLLPFFVGFGYVHPSADDFTHALDTMDEGFWSSLGRRYMTWGGRYFAEGLVLLNPMVVESIALYRAELALMAVVFLVATWRLVSVSATKLLKLPRSTSFVAYSFLVLCLLGGMPNVAQFFYWLPATATYLLSASFLCFYLAEIVDARSSGRVGARQWVVLTIATIAVGGSSEVGVIALGIVVVAIVVVSFTSARWLSRPAAIVLLVLYTIAAGASILAPGNFVRLGASQEGGIQIGKAADIVVYSGYHFLYWLGTTTLVPLVLVAFFHGTHREAPSGSWNVRRTMALAAVPPVIIVILFALPTLSTPDLPSPRVLNLIYLLFMTTTAVVLWLVLSRVDGGSAVGRVATAALVVFALLSVFMSPMSAVRTAYEEWLSGTYRRYDDQLEARYEIIRDSADEDVVVPALTARPETLFFADIESDPTNWKNRPYAQYFGKETIRTRDGRDD